MKKSKEKANKGITLIALVITIIVLLILAGISIATLTGENGVLTKGGKAKDITIEAGAIEKVQVEVMGSYNNNLKLDIDLLNKNLKNILNLTYNAEPLSETNKILKLPATVEVDNIMILINGNGKVEKPLTLQEAKNIGKVFEEKTEKIDIYGNKVTIPKGFKIAADSATDVTGGVVIEDVNHPATKGSQFVWIPVGNINSKMGVKSVEVGRYTFASKTGAPSLTTSSEMERDDVAIPKVLQAFKNKSRINEAGGFYVGRFEARSSDGVLVYNGELPVIVDPKRSKAVDLSRSMYNNSESDIIGDLINGYAWDTMTVFLQAFDDRSDTTTPYSLLNIVRTSWAPNGTNNLPNPKEHDKICNIWDLAGNRREWSTEYCHSSSQNACSRGGCYLDNTYNHSYMSRREEQFDTGSLSDGTFRSILIF